jgi:SAM-dependent methyltransferase
MFNSLGKYNRMLHQGIGLSGEDKFFFIRGRLRDLYYCLPNTFVPERILDFGCGFGDTTKLLAELFPQAHLIGLDTSEKAIEYAHQAHGSSRISFWNISELSRIKGVDLCYANGVFHHIIPEERVSVIDQIHRALKTGGYFALFENNPWNPGTRMVMKRIPFDQEARAISSFETRRLLHEGGFSILYPTRFLFIFPRFLSSLRFLELTLSRFPLGAQYYILAKK